MPVDSPLGGVYNTAPRRQSARTPGKQQRLQARERRRMAPEFSQSSETESHAKSGDSGGCAAVILAAGKSTRMRSKLPKPLHPLCGLPLTRHVVNTCREAGVEQCVVVIG